MARVAAVSAVDEGPQLIVYGKDGRLRARIGIGETGKLQRPFQIEEGETVYVLKRLPITKAMTLRTVR